MLCCCEEPCGLVPGAACAPSAGFVARLPPSSSPPTASDSPQRPPPLGLPGCANKMPPCCSHTHSGKSYIPPSPWFCPVLFLCPPFHSRLLGLCPSPPVPLHRVCCHVGEEEEDWLLMGCWDGCPGLSAGLPRFIPADPADTYLTPQEHSSIWDGNREIATANQRCHFLSLSAHSLTVTATPGSVRL